jgi:DNA-binding NarL/FixJ family response regulator
MSTVGYTVLVIDDQPIIRHALRELLKRTEDPPRFYEAADPEQALPMIRRSQPDIVVLDLSFPKANGLEAIGPIRNASPKTKVVVFTVYASSEIARMAIRAGARGFVTKLDPPEDLIQAIIAVRSKKMFLSHRLVKESMSLSAILGTVDQVVGTSAAETQLSNREIEAIKLLAQGKTNAEVAIQLHISVRTVEAHRAHVMRKMKFTSLAELIRFAVRMKWTEP